MLDEKINNDRKTRNLLRGVLVLLMVVSGVVFANAVIHLFVRFYTNRYESFARINRATLADAKRIDRITGTVQRLIGNIGARIEQNPSDEKALLNMLSHRNTDRSCPFAIGFLLNDSSRF